MTRTAIQTEQGERTCLHDNQGRAHWPADMSGGEMVRALRLLYEAEAELERRLSAAIEVGKKTVAHREGGATDL